VAREDSPQEKKHMDVNATIVELAEGAGVALRRVGREMRGPCPLCGSHSPNNSPPFVVNPERQLFHCFSCGAGGDAIEFTKRLHGTDFKGALEILGAKQTKPPPPDPRVAELKLAYAWARKTSNTLSWILWCIGKKIHAAGIAEDDLENPLIREWTLLSDLDEDLNAHKFVEFPEEEWPENGKSGTWTEDRERVLELWHSREWVESILDNASTTWEKRLKK
jgi:CHC2 zinc finger